MSVAIELPTTEVKRYQNTISDTFVRPHRPTDGLGDRSAI